MTFYVSDVVCDYPRLQPSRNDPAFPFPASAATAASEWGSKKSERERAACLRPVDVRAAAPPAAAGRLRRRTALHCTHVYVGLARVDIKTRTRAQSFTEMAMWLRPCG
eukprot:GHVU01118241.1.p1 GENE.GHVU01118241.1~~GHVU01118241.1.p1  ORF type:complete len:108 (+),score=4.29 GHVU01118241.1:962-1285(+)